VKVRPTAVLLVLVLVNFATSLYHRLVARVLVEFKFGLAGGDPVITTAPFVAFCWVNNVKFTTPTVFVTELRTTAINPCPWFPLNPGTGLITFGPGLVVVINPISTDRCDATGIFTFIMIEAFSTLFDNEKSYCTGSSHHVSS